MEPPNHVLAEDYPSIVLQSQEPRPAIPASPRSLLNAVAQEDVNDTARAVAEGLAATIFKREKDYQDERNQLAQLLEAKEQTIADLYQRLKQAENPTEVDNSPPDGYEDNNGRVDVLVPVGQDMFLPAKYVRKRGDCQVEVLSGTDPSESPHVVQVYLKPRPHPTTPDAPVLPLPTWFLDYIQGTAPFFETLRLSFEPLDDWAALAELERARKIYEETMRVRRRIEELEAQLAILYGERAACWGRMERAHLPSYVSYLESQRFPTHKQMAHQGGRTLRPSGGPAA